MNDDLFSYETRRHRLTVFAPPVSNEPFNELRALGIIRSADWPKWHYNMHNSFTKIIIWCNENFGYEFVWFDYVIYFKHERDYALFLLRWS